MYSFAPDAGGLLQFGGFGAGPGGGFGDGGLGGGAGGAGGAGGIGANGSSSDHFHAGASVTLSSLNLNGSQT